MRDVKGFIDIFINKLSMQLFREEYLWNSVLVPSRTTGRLEIMTTKITILLMEERRELMHSLLNVAELYGNILSGL